MNLQIISQKLRIFQGLLYLIAFTLFLGCENESTLDSENMITNEFPETNDLSLHELAELLDAEELDPTVFVNAKSDDDDGERAAVSTIGFDHEDACFYTPEICNSSVVVWPGYLEPLPGGNWAYCWLSKGPRTNFLQLNDGGGYYIPGYLFPDLEFAAEAINGKQWFAFYMQRGGRINFDLTGIKVLGNFPVTLYFKDSNNKWWYYASLSPGTWNLGGALNIKEFHLTSASRQASDYWKIDNIKVKPL